MARKYELINDLYDQIIVDVTKEARAWQSFLRTACRNYKLRFDEQLLLFAQRPDATAVLEIERWNTAFGRWVNRGAKGIAVFEDSTGESQRLKYYFDIADTHGTEQSREVPVWKMSEEYQSNVAEALKNAFGTSTDSDDLRIVIKESVVNAVDDNIDDYIYGFVKSGTGSEIDYMKPEDAEEIYKRIVTNSVLYMIYERLGMDNLLTDDDFNGIEYFSTPELLNSIGYATGDIARMGLGIVSKTIRSTKKEKQQVIQPVINKISDNERSSYNERNHLHNAGRLSDSGSDITDTTGSYSRQMGRDEERISEAASQSNVLQSDDKRSVDAVSRRRGTESTEAGGQTDERNVGNTGADGRIESKRHDEMGTADEQSAQRSAGDSYSADNNERLSNYKPLPSIEEQTAFIEEFKAEVAKASAFSIPNEIINDHLANGSGFRDGKYRIYEQFRKSLSQKENADFLKNEYGIGGGTHAGGVSGYYYDHNAKGICISKGFADNATRINLNWLEVAKRIQLLINNDRYLNEKEKEHYAQWLNEREERQYTEQGLSTSENKDNEKYIYKVGDTVFIGASEYRITAKDDQQVMLSDANAPLFNKQYDIADFEHKIKENALNEHLKVILSEEESNTSVISETNTTPINDDDYYFNDAERKEVVAVYYNPDAISGGQFVFAHITYELISKAKDVASDTDSFYEYLDENAYTELIDVGTEEYRTVLSEYSDPNPDFIGRNEENMLQLIALAKNEKITYDKNGYHADDLDEGDLIKVDGEIWAVKSVSSYSMEYMKRLTGKEEDEIFNDLKGVIFLNPLYNGNDDNQVKYFMADEYLSGNVREKLAIAKKFAEADSSFNINIEALGKVQPEDLTASEISVRLGSTWLPVDIVQQFIYEFLNTPGYAKSSIIVHYSKYTGEWSIDGKSYDRSNVKAYNTYGSSRINAYKIIEETLNLKDVRIFDYVEDIDGSRKPVLNKKETAIAQSKQELIKQGFQEWVWSDPQRRERLCKLYNERFNSIRPREYDGSHIVFSGMNPEITLREHQRNAVAHILYGGNTLLAHAVLLI